MSAIRVGLVGYGTGGRVFHAPLVAATEGLELSAIVTTDPERRADVGKRYPDCVVVENVESLLAQDIDLVVVSSPPETHVAVAEAAIGSGRAVVLDKPFVVHAADGERLRARASKQGVLLTVFQNRRWDGDFRTLQELVSSGRLGSVTRFESRFEWWEQGPDKPWRSAASPERGGGILYDLGAHLIDQAILLFGPVEDSYAELDRRRPGAGAEDDAFVALTHSSGVRSQLWMSSVAPRRGPRFHVTGTRAGYTVWDLDPQEAALAAGADPRAEAFGRRTQEAWGSLTDADGTTAVPQIAGDYLGFYRDLCRALRDGAPPPVDPADSIRVIDLIEAVHAG